MPLSCAGAESGKEKFFVEPFLCSTGDRRFERDNCRRSNQGNRGKCKSILRNCIKKCENFVFKDVTNLNFVTSLIVVAMHMRKWSGEPFLSINVVNVTICCLICCLAVQILPESVFHRVHLPLFRGLQWLLRFLLL